MLLVWSILSFWAFSAVAKVMDMPVVSLPTLSVQQAISQNIPLIDTRPSANYNGWPESKSKISGHEPNALNLAAVWLPDLDNLQLRKLLAQKKLIAEKPIALYGSEAEIKQVQQRLMALGFHSIYRLTDALTDVNRLSVLPRYTKLVPANWLADLISGKPVVHAPEKNWKVIAVEWGMPKAYLLGHIPNSGYIDTNSLESKPLWNKVDNIALNKLLLEQGITVDTPVILYGRETMAAARAANILMYVGVKDVRLLDGGWSAWKKADYPTELGFPTSTIPAKNFGATIPVHPEYLTSLAQAKEMLQQKNTSLVSIRSWPEFIGETSGYSYINAKGDIPGAKWGGGGSDASHVEDLHNPDGTMRTASELQTMWKSWNIQPTDKIAFYCGTGWRASEAFFYAWIMGWKSVSVYDGGWYEWSLDPTNPIITGERKAQQIQ
ncbi:MAG: rhodanese-like domain-containing protein [Plesiomonas sp.]|uniref:rhodanese-like domain-containing protein n=1 Tax=Plesiomonas sp. TaxID=2486279 RepID=UPI003F2CDA53